MIAQAKLLKHTGHTGPLSFHVWEEATSGHARLQFSGVRCGGQIGSCLSDSTKFDASVRLHRPRSGSRLFPMQGHQDRQSSLSNHRSMSSRRFRMAALIRRRFLSADPRRFKRGRCRPVPKPRDRNSPHRREIPQRASHAETRKTSCSPVWKKMISRKPVSNQVRRRRNVERLQDLFAPSVTRLILCSIF